MQGGYPRALAAAQAYLESVSLLQPDLGQLQRSDAIRRALQLGILLQDTALIAAGKRAVRDELALGRTQVYPPLTLQLLRWLLKLRSDQVTRSELEAARDYAAAAAAFHGASGGERLFLARSAYEALAAMERRLGDNAAEWQAQLAIGETIERQAAQRAADRAVEGFFLEQAHAHYQRIGAKDRLDVLKVRIREAHRAAESDLVGTSVSTKVDVTRLDALADQLVTLAPAESLASYSTWAGRAPAREEMKRRTSAIIEKRPRPVPALLPVARFNDGRRVSTHSSEDEQRESRVADLYGVHLELRGAFLARVYRRLADVGHWTADVLADFLGAGVLFDEDKVPVLRAGFERYFARDYLSAVHLLVPHTEDVLRRVLAKLGLPTTTIDQKGLTKEVSLGDVLAAPALREGLGEDFAAYLEYLFTRQDGLNTRNDVAHGLLGAGQAGEGLVALLIDVLLRLRFFAITPAVEAAAGALSVELSMRVLTADILEPCAPGRDSVPAAAPSAAVWMRIAQERLVHEFHPLRVVVFGSQARGDARSDSDIDLLVVLVNAGDRREAAIAMKKALADLPVGVDIIVTDPDDIARRKDDRGEVLYTALREGRVLYDRE